MKLAFFLLIAVSLSSCRTLEKLQFWKRSPPSNATANVRDNFLGTVSTVNENGGFVLIDFGGFTAPSPGAELTVRRGGEDVATLRAGSEVRRPFAAADITKGNPQAGDDVWSKKPTP